MKRTRAFIFVASSFILLAAFQNCSNVSFTPEEQGHLKSLNTPPTITEDALKTLQPTLAVRGMSCVLCHAQIHANVITDFGYGTPSFMGGSANFEEDSWFNNLASAWQSSKIHGTVFVPDVPVSRKAQDVLGANFTDQPLLKIKDFMKVPYNSSIKTWVTEDEARGDMAYNIKPPPGQESIVAKSRITIRAPSENEIESLAPALWSANADVSGAVRVSLKPGDLSQLQNLQLFKRGIPGKTYMQNDENVVLECANTDIVVRGTLFLKRLKVNAAGGCRIYATGTVFIEDEITYLQGDLDNLQITSASAVMMGLDIAHMTNRLINEARGLELVSRNYSSLASQILKEAGYIGSLKDGEKDYRPEDRFNYSGLLLNAPIVHSRYLGEMRGTIISEAILFRLEHLQFHFDSVFTKVNVLPLLTKPVLTVE